MFSKERFAVIRKCLAGVLGWQRRQAIQNFLGARQDMCWVRTIGDRATLRLVNSLPVSDLSALEISGDAWRDHGFREYRSVRYPDYDICNGTLDETFDLIIAEHVFEHLLWPYRAGKNVYSMLKPGGRFMIAVPFLVPIHSQPYDCSRWTETGLKHLLVECGFDLDRIESGSWGNRRCVVSNLRSFLYYRQNLHSLKNESKFPVVVWAMARK